MRNEMWGGRFAAEPNAAIVEINASLGFDRSLYDHLLYAEDIEGSKAYAAMLAERNILSRADASAIMQGLEDIRREIESGQFIFKAELEDIYMNIEARLTEMIGEAAQRMHTARSRSDQMATDLRLWVRKQIFRIDMQLKYFQRSLAQKALVHAATVMPGYMHQQIAQPITFGHHLLAYVEMAGRDRGRFSDAQARLNECPLGAGMLAGISLPIDRKQTAELLGFARPMQNSLDAVSDRDFIIEAVSASAICIMHLTQLAEEIIVWLSPQFNFLFLSEPLVSNAPSLLQKCSPDVADVRAKTGRIYGALIGLLTMMKGMPLAYQKDMQEDKEPLFDALTSLSLTIEAMTRLIDDVQPNIKEMHKAAEKGFGNASDLTDWLVQKLKLSFRQAHTITGRLMKKAEEKRLPLAKFKLADLQVEYSGITDDVYSVLKPSASVNGRISEGGTAPKNVRAQARRWLKALRNGEE
jgi:argininosuccinate lyase